LATHFPAVIHAEYSPPHVVPSTRGETISQLHNRVATALAAIIADVDSEIEAAEARSGASDDKALLICSHAAPLIAMGRVLTGDMPRDVDVEDFKVYTAGLSTFVRRRRQRPAAAAERNDLLLAPGTGLVPPDQVFVPDWIDGKGVGGRWECVANGDCSFLSGGAERGW
jgi:transcription factor C subunit 7